MSRHVWYLISWWALVSLCCLHICSFVMADRACLWRLWSCIIRILCFYVEFYTVSEKNDTDVARYNFDAHQPILVIFGRDFAERVCYQLVMWFVIPPLLTNVSALPGKIWTWTPEIVSFSVMLYTVYRKQHCFGLLYLRHASTNITHRRHGQDNCLSCLQLCSLCRRRRNKTVLSRLRRRCEQAMSVYSLYISVLFLSVCMFVCLYVCLCMFVPSSVNTRGRCIRDQYGEFNYVVMETVGCRWQLHHRVWRHHR